MPRRSRVVLAAAGIAAMLLAGCRERRVPDAPAVPLTGDAPVEVPAMAEPLPVAELQAARATSLCSFDSADQHYPQGARPLAVGRGRPMRLRGWFADETHHPVGDFRIALAAASSAWSLPARTGAARPDTTEYFDEPAMGTAGFEQLADLSAISPGTYRVLLLAGHGDALLACDSGKRLELR